MQPKLLDPKLLSTQIKEILKEMSDEVWTHNLFDHTAVFLGKMDYSSTLRRNDCTGMSQQLSDNINTSKTLREYGITSKIIPFDFDSVYSETQFKAYQYGHLGVLVFLYDTPVGILDCGYGISDIFGVGEKRQGNGWTIWITEENNHYYYNGVKGEKTLRSELYIDRYMKSSDIHFFRAWRSLFIDKGFVCLQTMGGNRPKVLRIDKGILTHMDENDEKIELNIESKFNSRAVDMVKMFCSEVNIEIEKYNLTLNEDSMIRDVRSFWEELNNPLRKFIQ